MRCKTIVTQVVLLALLVGPAGCFSSHPRDIEAFLKPHEVEVAARSYTLEPPDEIEIHCSKVPEIHLQRQRIRPDGKVSFESLGEMSKGWSKTAADGGLKPRHPRHTYPMTQQVSISFYSLFQFTYSI